MELYKLTDQDGYTRRGYTGETKWETGSVVNLQPVTKPKMCSKDVVHAYTNPNLALLLNPIHADIPDDPLIWAAEGDVVIRDWGKVGCFQLTITTEFALPGWYIEPSTRKRVQMLFAVFCAEGVIHHYENSFPGDNRPRRAIEVASEYLKNPSAAWSAESAESAAAAAWSAESAAWSVRSVRSVRSAVRSAAWSAESAAWSVRSAVWSVRSAVRSAAWSAARSAAWSAESAAESAADEIDFAKLADKAVEEIKGGKHGLG